MAQIIIAGDAAIVKSAYGFDDIKKLKKCRPKALTLFDDDGTTEVFKVGVSYGVGNINSYGASFGSVSKSGDGKAIITMIIPSCVEDAEAYVEEVFGAALINLNKIESQFETALADVAIEQACVRESITVL